MARLRYNLADIEDFPSVDSGNYVATVKKVVQEKSKTSGNPMLTWTWVIKSKVVDRDAEAQTFRNVKTPMAGRTVRSWTSLQDNALGGMKQHVMGLGFKGKGPKQAIDLNTDLFTGKSAVIVVGKREGQTRDGNKAQFDTVISVHPLSMYGLGKGTTQTEDYDDEDTIDEGDEGTDEYEEEGEEYEEEGTDEEYEEEGDEYEEEPVEEETEEYEEEEVEEPTPRRRPQGKNGARPSRREPERRPAKRPAAREEQPRRRRSEGRDLPF